MNVVTQSLTALLMLVTPPDTSSGEFWREMEAARDAYVSGDYSQMDVLQRGADLRNPVAAYALGHAYLNGRGVARDDAKGLHYLTIAATTRYGPAVFALAETYEAGGEGRAPDIIKAFQWHREACRIFKDEPSCAAQTALQAQINRRYAASQPRPETPRQRAQREWDAMTPQQREAQRQRLADEARLRELNDASRRRAEEERLRRNRGSYNGLRPFSAYRSDGTAAQCYRDEERRIRCF